MNICVFLHLTHTEREREKEEWAWALYSFRALNVYFWSTMAGLTTIHTKTNKHFYFLVRSCLSSSRSPNAKKYLYDVCCRHEEKRAQHFHSLWCLFIILWANFSRFVFPFLSSSFDRFVCIPILLCCRHQHLIRIDSKNGSVQMQTPLFTENRVEIFAPFCPQ